MFELVFFPVNALFVAAPLIFWGAALVFFALFARFTIRTFNIVEGDVAKGKGFEKIVNKRFGRLVGNALIGMSFFYLLGGAATVAPRATIETRPSRNEAYLKQLDAAPQAVAGAQAGDTRSPSWEELSGRTAEAEQEQDDRIEATGRSARE
jgi:hypothetical protein